jgi:ectoine hydroxylase-related dioxygenase (phytanoyl-CoA dioxygenase family)
VSTLRAELDEAGFAVLPGLLAREAGAAAEAIAGILAERGWLADGAHAGDPVARGPIPSIVTTVFRDTQARVRELPEMRAVQEAEPLVETMRGLLGRRAFPHWQQILRLVPPVPVGGPLKTATPVHRELTAFEVEGMAVAWIALFPCGPEEGGLWVKRGSHRDGSPETEVDPADPSWATADYRCGDVVVFDCRTLHGTQRNRTPRWRVSLDLRWQPAAAADPASILERAVPDPVTVFPRSRVAID